MNTANRAAFRAFIRPFRNQILAAFALGLCSSLFGLLAPFLSKFLVDDAFLKRDIAAFAAVSAWGAVVFLASIATKTLESLRKARLSESIKIRLSESFLAGLYKKDYAFFARHGAGENAFALCDTANLAQLIVEYIPQILVDLARAVFILAAAALIDIRLTLAVMVISPLFLLQSVILQRKLRPLYDAVWQDQAELAKRLHESLSRISVIKTLHLERTFAAGYLRQLSAALRAVRKQIRWHLAGEVSYSFLAKSVYGLLTIFGGWLIIQGKLTLGSYAAVMIYLAQLADLLRSLAQGIDSVSEQSVSVDKFLSLAAPKAGEEQRPAGSQINDIRGRLRMRSAAFGYAEGPQLFNDLSLDIPAGSWAGLAGRSGCGKTTLALLLAGLYAPQRGEILLDDLELSALSPEAVSRAIIVVLQEPLLFDLSIRENILLGCAKEAADSLGRIIKVCLLEEYVSSLERGLDTPVGENAAVLSSGLKQRLCLARALIREPQVLILDEADSSLDPQTGQELLANIRQYRRGRTTLVIAHRISAFCDAQRVFFLNNGCLECASHQELFSRSSAYRAFFREQPDKYPADGHVDERKHVIKY